MRLPNTKRFSLKGKQRLSNFIVWHSHCPQISKSELSAVYHWRWQWAGGLFTAFQRATIVHCIPASNHCSLHSSEQPLFIAFQQATKPHTLKNDSILPKAVGIFGKMLNILSIGLQLNLKLVCILNQLNLPSNFHMILDLGFPLLLDSYSISLGNQKNLE